MVELKTDLADERNRMVDRQIAGRGVEDRRVLDAMRAVPRESFMPEDMAEFAYEDTPLPIGEGQTISQPYIVAVMAEAAEIGPEDRVLDIGTGSGYGAAVLSRMAAEVFTIERHGPLATEAEARLKRLRYGNVHVRHGDGTLGWPEAAPFDSIIAAASGPEVPAALRRQLAVGGCLVMPVGEAPGRQTLLRLRRTGEDEYEEENLGAVSFVPLVGEQGWPEQDRARARGQPPAVNRRPPAPIALRGETALIEAIGAAAEPLPDWRKGDFGGLFDRLGGARVVLLGEATHGTSEFYRSRALITQRLIRDHGFTIVAAEADWPDAARIDQYVRHRSATPSEEKPFTRFPTWMWRNLEVHDFVQWLHAHNGTIGDPARRAGFYGLDMYSLYGSISAVLGYLDKIDPEAARVARERYGCLSPWQRDPATYGRAALTSGFAPCEAEVLAMLRDILDKRLEYIRHDGEGFLDAEQNARLVAAAERYYRVMYYGSAESWNLRDSHMFETLQAVLKARGPDSKAVIWAHNSHIGNAAATEMGIVREEHNIGQLCRETFGDAAFLVGFGTDHGTVAAASDWDGPMQVKQVRPAHRDSYERLCHDSTVPVFHLDLRADGAREVRHGLLRPRLERAIGVIYRPETELASHYFEASLPRQFDAYLWFDETTAVTPLATEHVHGAPETYPFAV